MVPATEGLTRRPTATTSGSPLGHQPEAGPARHRLGHLDLRNHVRHAGVGARLLRVMVSSALDLQGALRGGGPPALVLTDTMVSTGTCPSSDEAYHVERDDLWAIHGRGPLTSLHRDEVLDEVTLLRSTGPHVVLPAGGRLGGKDTRGLCAPRVRQGRAAGSGGRAPVHRRPGGRARPQRGGAPALGLAYRVLDLCTADLGGSAAAPGTSRPTPRRRPVARGCRRCRGSPTTRPGGPTSATAPRARRAPRSPLPSAAWRPTARSVPLPGDPPLARWHSRPGRAIPPHRRR